MVRMNPVELLEALRRDEHYKRHNIFNYDYTRDVISQILKNYWETIEAGRDTNPDLADVWIDMTTAIDALPERNRKVVYAYAEGWRSTALIERTEELKASRLLSEGIGQMTERLRRGEDS